MFTRYEFRVTERRERSLSDGMVHSRDCFRDIALFYKLNN
jgi:hypothetical protein